MKKLISIILILSLMLTTFTAIASAKSEAYDLVMNAKTPTTQANTDLKWSKTFGDSVYNTPTSPVVADDYILTVSSNRLFKLDKKTGNTVNSCVLDADAGFSVAPVLYANNMIFVQMMGGKIQAFDFDTLKSLWVYTDKLGGQALTPITYNNGHIYTGFWNGEENPANYVCVSVEDENPNSSSEVKNATWTYTSDGGFYGAGAAVVGDSVYFGTDDGERGEKGGSRLVCVNKISGKVTDEVNLIGDVRSSAVYHEDRVYVTTKAGYIYGVKVNAQKGYMYQDLMTSYRAAGKMTTTPIIYNSRVYVSSLYNTIGEFIVLNLEDLSLIYKYDMLGMSQGSMLLSNYYEEATGKVYIYAAYNKSPGGITVFSDSETQTKGARSELFIPMKDFAQYGISNVVADNEGNIYFKNDSGNIFCLEIDSGDSFVEMIVNMITAFVLKILDIFKLNIIA